MKNSVGYLLASATTFIVGYIFLKFAFRRFDEAPFVQEIVLIVLGTIATIAITAALLNKQSEVEMEKEQRVKIFDLKSTLYFDLIDFIGGVISKGEITQKDLVELEFLTHKISTIANQEVLQEYSHFIEVVKKSAVDKKITALESDEMSASLASLCGVIRYDLISGDHNTKDEVVSIIKDNIESL